MIRTSIRLRLLTWLGLLLIVLVGGIAVTAYQLTKLSRLRHIDEEIERRIAAIAVSVRGGPDGHGGPGFPPDWHGFPPDGYQGGMMTPFSGPNFHDKSPARNSGGTESSGPGQHGPPAATANSAAGGSGKDDDGMLPEPPDLDEETRDIQLPAETLALFAENDPQGYFFIAWSGHGRELKRSANAPAGLQRPHTSPMQPGIRMFTARGYRLGYYASEPFRSVLVGFPIGQYEQDLRAFLSWISLAGVLVLAASLGTAWVITSRALAPIGEIAEAAKHIAVGNLNERITTSEPGTELGRLAAVLNSTFARLEASFAQQRQFTADASHEIRTPLTVIISEAQATLARPRSEAEYRETLETCLEAAQDMRRLADSLLELARLDGGLSRTAPAPVDLAELAQGCINLVRPLADARGITIGTQFEPATLKGDVARLRQVVINLLDNAIYYNYDRGTIRVETRTEAETVALIVSDSGRGIAPEDLPHIFKRFYRADKARTHQERRAGLGLAIVKAIVVRAGGSVGIHSELEQGTTVTVRLPLAKDSIVG